jgi:hypothetical protein
MISSSQDQLNSNMRIGEWMIVVVEHNKAMFHIYHGENKLIFSIRQW